MYAYPTYRSLGMRESSLDSTENGARSLKAVQRTMILLFNKIWQMALGFATISQHVPAIMQAGRHSFDFSR